MNRSIAITTLLVFAAFAAPTNAGESMMCSDRCQVISCKDRSCSISTCQEGACFIRAEFEADSDYTSAAGDQVHGDGDGIHCGRSRCAVATCDAQTCNTFGFERGTIEVVHTATNPAAERNRAVQQFLASDAR